MQETRGPIDVLHVDDDPDLAELVARFVEREDDRFAVETAADVTEGLERLEADAFDCVVSDYDMPGRNGIEFLEAVRADYPDLPFILYTGKGSEEVASDAISAGVTDYLQKESGTGQYALLANRIANAVETHRTRTRLAEREAQLTLFFEQSPLGVIEWDDRFELVRMNEAAEEILGYTEAQLRGESWEALVPDDDWPDVDGVVSDLLENEGGYHSVNANVRADGERIRCEWYNRVVTDDDGAVVAVFSQFQEVTDRERRDRAIEGLHDTAREILRADSDEQVAETVVRAARDLLEMPINGVAMYDPEREVLETVASTDRSDAVVGDWPTFRPGESLAWSAFEAGETRHYDDVSTVPGRHNPTTPIRSEIIVPLGEYGVVLVGSTAVGAFDEVDVSLAETLATHAETALGRLARERELRERNRRHEVLFENSPDMIDILDAEGRLVDVNRRFCAELGYDEADVLGTPIWELDTLVDEADVRDLLADFSLDERRKFEGRYERSDGSTVPVEVHLLLLDVDGEDRFLAISRDITERKEYEQRLERQNDRLDRFARVVSHDIRNPLTVAYNRLELAREERDSEHLERVAAAHDRMNALVDDLLAWARERERTSEVEPVALSTLVADCWRHVDTAEATLQVESTRTVRADGSRLQRLFENLLRNAVEHGGEDVTVTVGDLDGGFYLEDDGPGIPAGEREAVFEAGYSTVGDGTGYGLSIVAEVVAGHGWEIRVTDGTDGGARFEITGVEVVA